jgi:hypothetical protein
MNRFFFQIRKMISQKNGVAVTVLMLLSFNAFAQSSCGFFDKKIKLADGASLCVKDVPFFNRTGLISNEPNSSYASKAQQSSSFAVAASSDPKSCPFATFIAWDWGYGRDAAEALPKCNERLKEAVKAHGKLDPKVECKCDILVDSSITSKLTKQALTERTELFEKQIAIGNKPLNLVAVDALTKIPLQSNAISDELKKTEVIAQREADERKKVALQREDELKKTADLALAQREADERKKLTLQREDELKKTEALALSQREADERKKVALQREDELKKTDALAVAQRQLEDLKKIAMQRDEELKKLKIELAQANRPTSNSNRRALVIGNDSYKQITKLLNAREDAKAVADSLEQVGYMVTLKLDLTEKEMKSALRVFKSQINGGEEVVIFYAGHGVQLGSSNYLLPTDIAGENEEQIKDEAIQLQRILDDMTEKKAKLTLVMLDACRDNPFKVAGRNIGGRGLAPTSAANGQMVIFSAGTGQQALDRLGPNDKDKNGVFTRVLIKEMKNAGVSVDKLIRNVRTQVVTLAQSIGHEQVPAIYDQVVGDFYFKK